MTGPTPQAKRLEYSPTAKAITLTVRKTTAVWDC